MKCDGNKYAKEISEGLLPYSLYKTSSKMINVNSGFDIKYQENKVHNLKLAAKKINKVVINPNETFSFWKLVQHADKHEPYKDGLLLVNGEIVGSYGGGLCQLSNLLFELFINSPLTIVERHGHAVKSFPGTSDFASGIDATISEGWKDLKVKNNTENSLQIVIEFDDEFIYGKLLSDTENIYEYKIFNSEITYHEKNNKIIEKASVDRKIINTITGKVKICNLYNNICEIGYELPEEVKIER